jgi:Mat/Ecp fimbriae major subunit
MKACWTREGPEWRQVPLGNLFFHQGEFVMKFANLKAAIAGTVIAAAAFGSTAAQAATASADAKAVILAAVTVAKSSDLDFGTIAIGTSGGAVTVNFANAATCTGGLVCPTTVTSAGFNVTGVTGQTVSVSVDPTVTLDRTGGGATMSATLSSNVSTIVLDGTDAFVVGGVLTVAGTQMAGNYAKAFNVLVNYQ